MEGPRIPAFGNGDHPETAALQASHHGPIKDEFTGKRGVGGTGVLSCRPGAVWQDGSDHWPGLFVDKIPSKTCATLTCF
jgi:hypothetical protein